MGQVAVYTLPAPVGGLNTVDPIAQMPENDAIDLVNLYPDGQRLVLRKGYSLYSFTPTIGETLIQFVSSDGTCKLLVANDSNLVGPSSFYEITFENITNITGPTDATSGQFNGGMFRGQLWLCNGIDTVQTYTGTGNFADATYTGVTLSTLINQSAYYDRNYFVERDSGSFWYSGQDAINGALTKYDISSFMSLGGKLLFAGSYSNRIGQTTSELFMACTSEGELFFFQGIYPSDTTTPWRLVAHYEIAKPLGHRAFIRVDSDMWIITEQGIVPVSMLFSGQSTVAANTVSRKVNRIIKEYAEQIGFSHFWHGVYKKKDGKVFIVVPTSSSSGFYLVCNIETGAWTKYADERAGLGSMLAMCDQDLYMCRISGTDVSAFGFIYKMEDGQSDDGQPIEFEMRTAFSFYGSRQNFKIFKELRPLMFGLGGTDLEFGVDTDFQLTEETYPIFTTASSTTAWYSAWYSAWSQPERYLYNRFGLRGAGHSGSLHMTGSVEDSSLEFSVFEVRFEAGAQV